MRCLVTMKKHTTVTITKKMLEKMGACEGGIADVADFLPAKLSTDPEQNVDLAIALVEANRQYRTWWLLKQVTSAVQRYHWCDDRLYEHDKGMVISTQQQLADIADAIATERGK